MEGVTINYNPIHIKDGRSLHYVLIQTVNQLLNNTLKGFEKQPTDGIMNAQSSSRSASNAPAAVTEFL